MLTIENVHKTFFAGTANEKVALRGVNLTLNDGDFVTVIGSNLGAQMFRYWQSSL